MIPVSPQGGGGPLGGPAPDAALSDFLIAHALARFIVLTIPPDTAMTGPAFDPVAFDQEQRADSPGIAELIEPDGMHTTRTVDYGIVLQGEVVLELDGGQLTPLAARDIVIQNGTRHGWRNRSDLPATVAFVLIGAETGH
jgi:hypothetical protein